jgi:plasmid stabilization system protein ParE
MDYDIRLSAQALADAAEVVERIASTYVRMAARWFTGLLRALDSLRTFPERCPLAPEADAFQRDIRQLFYGKRRNRYRILFVVEGDTVHILRILHGARESLKP